MARKKKLIMNKCEIEGCEISDPNLLNLHHIIHRSELNTTNDINNLCILCLVHHNYVHSGRLKIIGVFPSTQLPNGRTVVYELDGIRNIDIDPIIEHKNKSYKIGKT